MRELDIEMQARRFMQVPVNRLSPVELIDEEDELDLNEILRLADENATPPQDN